MRVLQMLGALLLLVASPAFANSNAALWTVTQRSGDVLIQKKGLQPASAQVRSTLSPGDTIATGVNGRAMLTRGDDYVVVAPRSRLVLPQEQQPKGFTRLIQQVGTMLYKVKHTGVPHFAVDTPMLAAVVKGTSFTIVVDKDRTALQVTDGVVEVSSSAGDASRLVERGVTVYVGRERPHEIIEMKPGSANLPATSGNGSAVKIETSGDVPLSTVTDLTGGLVRETPVAPVAAVANTPVPAAVPATVAPGTTVAPVTTVVTPVVDAVAPVVVAPAVDTSVPAITSPIVDVVETTVPTVVEPVVDIVDAATPEVVDPVVEIVETTVPVVTSPVVEIVDAVIPTVTEPVVEIVEPVVEIVEPVVDVVETVIPTVTEPIGGLLGGLFGSNSGTGSSNSGSSGSGGNSGPGGGSGG